MAQANHFQHSRRFNSAKMEKNETYLQKSSRKTSFFNYVQPFRGMTWSMLWYAAHGVGSNMF